VNHLFSVSLPAVRLSAVAGYPNERYFPRSISGLERLSELECRACSG